MIDIAGAVQRAFTFPADLSTTCEFFGDFRRVIALLPHIRLVRAFSADRYRVLYRTVELGVYDVRLYCDLHVRFDRRHAILQVQPADSPPPIKSRVTLTSLTAHGRYQSTSEFLAAGRETQVNYRLALNARLPKPVGLQLISNRAVERIAHSIVMWRIHEIADGFIERSIGDFEKKRRRRR